MRSVSSIRVARSVAWPAGSRATVSGAIGGAGPMSVTPPTVTGPTAVDGSASACAHTRDGVAENARTASAIITRETIFDTLNRVPAVRLRTGKRRDCIRASHQDEAGTGTAVVVPPS